MTADAPEPLARTACFAAAARALGSQRPDVLFVDPLAADLAGTAGTLLLQGLPSGAAQTVRHCVSQIACPGSWLGLDVPSRPVVPERYWVEEPRRWMDSVGWNAEVSTLTEAAASYGRRPYPPRTASDSSDQLRVFFVAARWLGT
jgi:O-methyltransferase involved in polyketide biosynthesis